jgi:hypothetical protein
MTSLIDTVNGVLGGSVVVDEVDDSVVIVGSGDVGEPAVLSPQAETRRTTMAASTTCLFIPTLDGFG